MDRGPGRSIHGIALLGLPPASANTCRDHVGLHLPFQPRPYSDQPSNHLDPCWLGQVGLQAPVMPDALAPVCPANKPADREGLQPPAQPERRNRVKLRAVATEIDDMLDRKLNPGPQHVRIRMVLDAMIKELESTGKLLLADGAPVQLSTDGSLLHLYAGGAGYTSFISSCGLPPGDGWDKKLTEELLGRDLPACKI